MSMRADSVTDTTSFQKFLQLCDAQGLSSKPDGLADNDVSDGLFDEETLRYCCPRLSFLHDAYLNR